MPDEKESPLSKIQTLYLMQVELCDFLEAKEVDATKLKTAQKTLKEFKELLKEADWRYMGGEDVLENMQWIPKEVNEKLKTKKQRKTKSAARNRG